MIGSYSNDVRELTISPGCPWYDAQQSFGAPNVNWCEPTICSIINEPANTWSNLPYIIVGLLLLRILKDRELKPFGLIVIFMGIMSGVYHASNNYMTQLADFIGMFTMMSFLISFNLKRLSSKLFCNFYATFWFFVFLNTLIFLCFDIMNLPVQKIMLINTVPILILDLLAGVREQKLHKYQFFLATFALLGAAQAFAIVDIQRIYCEPDNQWLHGHVVWHCLSAVAMLFAGLHIKRMRNPRLF